MSEIRDTKLQNIGAMKPINTKKIIYMVSNMMTNKEVVSIQKLLMTFPLSAKNTSTENKKNTLLHICIKTRQEESERWQ